MPSVSIIIASSHSKSSLPETLASLVSIHIPPSLSAHLILVESGPKLLAESLLASLPPHPFSSLLYLHQPAQGKSAALNLALTHATGDLLVFTDDDLRFPRLWLESLTQPILAGAAHAVAGAVELAPHLLRPWMNHTHRAWLASTADYLDHSQPSELCGANMAISRLALQSLDGFDPHLGPGITGGGEESLLSWQLLEAGFTIAPALLHPVIHHPNPQRLQYQSWITAASLKGQTDAYLLHHWLHLPIPFPKMRAAFFQTKLDLRRRLSPKRSPLSEGIPPWELSYLQSLAKFQSLATIQSTPRNYPRRGLKKIAHSSPLPSP